MKQYVFAIGVILGVLAMGAAAWLIRNGALTVPESVRKDTAQASAELEAWQNPLEAYSVMLPFGAAYDQTHGQWFARDYALLSSSAGTAVRAMKSGRVVSSVREENGWSISVEHADGSATVYGGLSGGVREGACMDGGELIGYLAQDTLRLSWRKDDSWADPARILS